MQKNTLGIIVLLKQGQQRKTQGIVNDKSFVGRRCLSFVVSRYCKNRRDACAKAQRSNCSQMIRIASVKTSAPFFLKTHLSFLSAPVSFFSFFFSINTFSFSYVLSKRYRDRMLDNYDRREESSYERKEITFICFHVTFFFLID